MRLVNRKDFSKAKNAAMNAAKIRRFADEFAARTSRITAILHESAGMMDDAGDQAEIVPIVSMWEKLLDRMEEGAVKQFRAKARAEVEIQRLLRKKKKES
jgi:NAD(P)-dependent dehydrogenase (short-subunit alcohol dehydrogenase family)